MVTHKYTDINSSRCAFLFILLSSFFRQPLGLKNGYFYLFVYAHVCVRMWIKCMHGHPHAMVHVWQSEDNLGCSSSPSTMLIHSLFYPCCLWLPDSPGFTSHCCEHIGITDTCIRLHVGAEEYQTQIVRLACLLSPQ